MNQKFIIMTQEKPREKSFGFFIKEVDSSAPNLRAASA